MQYMGSKNKIAKYILPIMLQERKPHQWWVEPFVGGANMIDKVDGNRIGNDNNPFIIALLRAAQNKWVPPVEVSKELYYSVKRNPSNYSAETVGFVGFLCSFGGKWWGGYAHNKRKDNYAAQGSRAVIKQAPKLKGIKFTCESYLSLKIPPNSLIYCDPPYESTTAGYKAVFDNKIFWQWCRDKFLEGHTVYISEYKAPEDFVCLKEVNFVTILNNNLKSKRIEKLFKFRGSR